MHHMPRYSRSRPLPDHVTGTASSAYPQTSQPGWYSNRTRAIAPRPKAPVQRRAFRSVTTNLLSLHNASPGSTPPPPGRCHHSRHPASHGGRGTGPIAGMTGDLTPATGHCCKSHTQDPKPSRSWASPTSEMSRGTPSHQACAVDSRQAGQPAFTIPPRSHNDPSVRVGSRTSPTASPPIPAVIRACRHHGLATFRDRRRSLAKPCGKIVPSGQARGGLCGQR